MASSRVLRPRFEVLEDRCVPATFTVKNLNDAGPGSLRQAVLSANDTPATGTIVFKSTLKGTITLTTGEIDITRGLVISGPGVGRLTISGNSNSRIFNVDNGTTNFINVTIRGLGLTNGRAVTGGGAILNRENLTIARANLRGNQAEGEGGAIFSAGNLTLVKSTLSGNMVFLDKGGSKAYGGAVSFGVGTLSIKACSFFDNQAARNGGGLWIKSTTSPATILNSTFSENRALRGAGIASSGALVIQGGSITGNSTAFINGDGGGIWQGGGSLSVNTCTIAGNTAGTNGGGLSITGGVAVLTGSTIARNTAAGSGGGLSLTGTAEVTVRNSTISGNLAMANGGGIAVQTSGSLLVQNSTVAFNVARTSGGGIFTEAAVSLESTIVARNQKGTGTGNDLCSASNPGDPFTIAACLIGNTGGAEINEFGTNNQLDVDPLLGPLAFNGGPTQTHALLPGSPAINHGSNPAGLLADQRGLARTRGGFTDIGAVEQI